MTYLGPPTILCYNIESHCAPYTSNPKQKYRTLKIQVQALTVQVKEWILLNPKCNQQEVPRDLKYLGKF